MLTVQVYKGVVFVGVVGDGCTVVNDALNGEFIVNATDPMTDNTSMHILFTFTKDTLTTSFGHLKGGIEDQHLVTMCHDTTFVRTLKRFNAKAFAMQIKVDEYFHVCFLSGRLDINPVTLCHKAYESHIIICTDPDAMM
jgi:hypothetical protein